MSPHTGQDQTGRRILDIDDSVRQEDDPFLAQLVAVPLPTPPVTTLDPRRVAAARTFSYDKCIQETLSLPFQSFGTFTSWSVTDVLLYAMNPDPDLPKSTKPIDLSYLAHGRLSPRWLSSVAPPATREAAGTWLNQQQRRDIADEGASLPFIPEM
jgi:hypothetical protein